MDALRVLSALSAIVGLIFTLMKVLEEVRKALTNVGLPAASPPRDLLWELIAWGVVSALIGGLMWSLLWGKAIGGDGKEPHGWWAALWPIATMFVPLASLLFLNYKYKIGSPSQQLLLEAVWLGGAIVGSIVFYDCPLGPFFGFRDLLIAKVPTYSEFWLVLIWSALLCLPGLIAVLVLQCHRGRIALSLDAIWVSVIRPGGLAVSVTTFAVVVFILVYRDRVGFEQARGVLAGLVLRTMLFISVFAALHSASEASDTS